MCSVGRCAWVGCFAGGALILLGILLLAFVPTIVNNEALKRDWLGKDVLANGTLVPNSMTKLWQKPGFDMRLSIWMYNVSNAMDAMNGSKPMVQEIGPFVFIEHQEKSFNVTANGTRIMYRNNKKYVFSKEYSCSQCVLTSSVTIPNILFQKLVDIAAKNFFYKEAIEIVLKVASETAFITTTVGEALFDGYHDPLLDKVCSNYILKTFCKSGQIPEKIGFFYGKNDTNDGVYEISSGLGDAWSIGKLLSWNNLTKVDSTVWDYDEARMISGTDGQLFSPMLSVGSQVQIFASPICRSLLMNNVDSVVYRDIPALRYSIPLSTYDSSYENNYIFCNKADTPVFFNESIQQVGCPPRGLLDVGRCQPSQPRIYISPAHFLGAPEEVWASVSGIAEPSMKNDGTAVDIEPTTGTVIRAKSVMQMNLGMVKGNLNVMSNFPSNLIVPMFWMNETALVDDITRDQLMMLVGAKHYIYLGGVGSVTAGGICWLAIAAMVIIYTVSKSPEDTERQPILSTENEETNDLEEGLVEHEDLGPIIVED